MIRQICIVSTLENDKRTYRIVKTIKIRDISIRSISSSTRIMSRATLFLRVCACMRFSTVKRKRELVSTWVIVQKQPWNLDREDESHQSRAIGITSLCRSIVRMQESYAMTRSVERTRKMKIGHSRRLFLDNIRLSNRNLVSNL